MPLLQVLDDHVRVEDPYVADVLKRHAGLSEAVLESLRSTCALLENLESQRRKADAHEQEQRYCRYLESLAQHRDECRRTESEIAEGVMEAFRRVETSIIQPLRDLHSLTLQRDGAMAERMSHALREAGRAPAESLFELMQPVVQATVTRELEPLKVMVTSFVRDQQALVKPAVVASVVKGSRGEEWLYERLAEEFRATDGYGMEKVTNGRGCDMLVTKDERFPVRVEVKDYARTVPRTEVEKFKRDLQTTGHHGVMVSLGGTKISGVRHMDFEVLPSGRFAAYCVLSDGPAETNKAKTKEDAHDFCSLVALVRLLHRLCDAKETEVPEGTVHLTADQIQRIQEAIKSHEQMVVSVKHHLTEAQKMLDKKQLRAVLEVMGLTNV